MQGKKGISRPVGPAHKGTLERDLKQRMTWQRPQYGPGSGARAAVLVRVAQPMGRPGLVRVE